MEVGACRLGLGSQWTHEIKAALNSLLLFKQQEGERRRMEGSKGKYCDQWFQCVAPLQLCFVDGLMLCNTTVYTCKYKCCYKNVSRLI